MYVLPIWGNLKFSRYSMTIVDSSVLQISFVCVEDVTLYHFVLLIVNLLVFDHSALVA